MAVGSDVVNEELILRKVSSSTVVNTRTHVVALLEEQLTDQRHDLFTRRGLGHLAGKLYSLLRQHPSLTIDSAARLLGVTARHTATILSRLRRHKLLVVHRDGWARSKQDLRNQAALQLGVLGTLLARAERSRIEREVWAWWQAELTTMMSTPRSRPRRPHVSSRPLFEASRPGERVWPRYPRASSNLADHRSLAGHGRDHQPLPHLGQNECRETSGECFVNIDRSVLTRPCTAVDCHFIGRTERVTGPFDSEHVSVLPPLGRYMIRPRT